MIPPIQRFVSKFSVCEESGCWEWNAAIQYKGYGWFNPSGKPTTAHRFSYQAFIGPIPPGLHIDHLCRNRKCVNPGHLEAVAPEVNSHRADNRLKGSFHRNKTVCKHGHQFTPENTLITKRGRACRKCANRIQAAWKRRVREKTRKAML